MIECEKEFWVLRRLGLEVVGGIGRVVSLMRRRPGISVKYFNELAVYHEDILRAPKVPCLLLPIKRPGFSLRAVWIQGYPHVSPVDFIESFIDSANRYYRNLAEALLNCQPLTSSASSLSGVSRTSENRRKSPGSPREGSTLRGLFS